MNPIERRNAFTFAEIVVAAPWLADILAQSQDNDKAVMLHRNRWTDEGSGATDVVALEAVARRERAMYLRAAFTRLRAWLTARPRRAHARA
jgi:hypothetical protein